MVETILSTSTLLGHFGIIILLGLLFTEKESDKKTVTNLISKNVLLLGFLATLGALIGSLYYSEFIGFEPCKLCWIQRIFLFPQVLLFGIALWKKQYTVLIYSVALSVLGGLVAIYQYLTQMTNIHPIGCSIDTLASCSQRLVFAYGYITIPLMSFTLFVFLILISTVYLKNNNSNENEG